MTRTQVSAIAIALGTLLAGQAMAADNGAATRAQVKAELAEAVRTGNILHHSGLRMNEVYSAAYSSAQNVASKSREQVKQELAEAVRTGDIAHHSGQRMNEIYVQG